jgi:hypothetical protein
MMGGATHGQLMLDNAHYVKKAANRLGFGGLLALSDEEVRDGAAHSDREFSVAHGDCADE